MPQLLASILDQVRLSTFLDIGITALLIYWLFSLIRGTSAVRLVIGVTVLFAVYFAARILNLRLLTQILETGAVVGLWRPTRHPARVPPRSRPNPGRVPAPACER